MAVEPLTAEQAPAVRGPDPGHLSGSVALLIALAASAASAIFVVEAHSAWAAISARPTDFVCFVGLTLLLQLVTVEIYGRGAVSFASTGMLAVGFVFGPGAAMLVAVIAAFTRLAVRRGKLHRGLFDAAAFALAAGAAAAAYSSFAGDPVFGRVGGALLAGSLFLAVNVGLLSLAMSLSEETKAVTVWRERFQWMTPYGLAAGPLAFAVVLAFEKVGLAGVLAFSLPPAFMMVSARQYLTKTRAAVEELRDANTELSALAERVRKTHRDTIAALSRSMEVKDYDTGEHTGRVSDVAVALADRLGFTGEERDAIEIGALLHDIGKIGIPERILQKPGPLNDEEWGVMKKHPIISEYVLSDIDLHPFVRQIARSSHERVDGAGYPDGLAGEKIPLPARIVLVADAFDALVSDRPYRPGRTVAEAVEELRLHAGTQFCPTVMAAFERIYREDPEFLEAGQPRRPRLVRAA